MITNPYENVKPNEGFDWDVFVDPAQITAAERASAAEAYDATLGAVKDKEIVVGKVTAMTKKDVTVSVGFKSEGLVPLSEFRYNPDLKVGDDVEVFVESVEDRTGQLILSHRKACSARSWERINEAFEKEDVVRGYISSRTRGGMLVDVFGVECFLPGSQIDVRPTHDFDLLVGQTMDFKILKISAESRNVVVSRKVLVEAELAQQKKEVIAQLKVGNVYAGVVKNITNYGAFIDLGGGVDGLVHITDLSWGRVNSPEEVLQLNESIDVVVLSFDPETERIALGRKQCFPHPWDSLDPNLKVGDKVTGRVVVLTEYGAFVEIVPGVEGLIHVSEMSWTQHLRSAHEFHLKVGSEVEAQILTLDRADRKISLGIKQLTPDPWADIEQRFPVGSQHTAKVRNFSTFGVFVEFEDGVDGLIHISDLSWTKKIKHPSEFTQVGASIEVVILEIDKENRRISLGHKQLEENPWDVFETVFTVGSVHEGTVTELLEKGAVVSLPYGVEGFATPRHLVKVDGSSVQLGETLSFKVIEFAKDSKRIILSHSRIHEDEQKAKRQEVAGEQRRQRRSEQAPAAGFSNDIEKTTLGDLEELAALKEKLMGDKK